tara:strand:+ start:542 stop:1120 length:579 start_codon:yes stop_codon:yes gene_type:complete
MPLTTSYKKLKSLTLDSKKLTDTHLNKINQIIKSVIDNKKDEYWENYKNYKISDQTAITLLLDDDIVIAFSSIINKRFYGDNVYRIFNRFLIDQSYRETGGSKTYFGEHRFFEMIHQQYLYVQQLNPKFIFMSRQRKNTRWLNWYFSKFNDIYGTDFVVSKNQYRICDGSDYDCCQTLIYPKEMDIPFEKII